MDSKNRTPVIVIFGPTACGKTELVSRLFNEGYEIINADSEQVYRELKIGTARPGDELLKRIPHHLTGILEPSAEFSVGDFVRGADRLVSEIWRRGRQPVVCGGSAYFIKHFIYGLPQTPPSDPLIRKQIQVRLEREGREALHAQLAQLDPLSAKRIAVNDVYRLTRALEIISITGQPLSALKYSSQPREAYLFLLIGLLLERKELLTRIEARVEQMFAAGLLKEFAALLDKGYSVHDPALRAIGYRELFGYLQGCLSLSELKRLIIIHTRQYAKKQMTFFKGLAGVKWYKPTELDKIKEAIALFVEQYTS